MKNAQWEGSQYVVFFNIRVIKTTRSCQKQEICI